ncbi:hypothetical protein TNCV_2690571 [Trichonephila clavipes]|uniref:Uncharacterized protein n=1 Tax=Trichonephila clavipes TaxID=2585209 RepID=A0A8X6VYX5_TRICX|nr:hypothetical protein TNCV_2690571 [Trichonephila clavipes]
MPPDRQQDQIKTHNNHRGKRVVVHQSLTVALSTIQMTVRFDSVPPQFRGRTPWGWSEVSQRLDSYLEYPQVAKTLYIYEHPGKNPGPTPQQPTSPIAIPNG